MAHDRLEDALWSVIPPVRDLVIGGKRYRVIGGKVKTKRDLVQYIRGFNACRSLIVKNINKYA